jgi:hypothetical protein
MGRAITPTAVRRVNGGEVEVLSASGFWTKHSLLSEGALANLHAAMRAAGHPEWFPPEVFYWHLPPVEDDNKGGATQQDDGTQGSGGGDVTIEDIVRRIAGEMDDAESMAMIGMTLETFATKDELAKSLSEFQPKPSGDGSGEMFTITTKIEVKTPQGSKSKDGIFHNQFDKLTKLVAAGQHTYLPGPPGTGKSHAAEQVASVLGWRFASISLGPTTPESRLWGGMDAHGKFFEPPFVTLARHAADNPESGSVFCLDELDNGHAGTIATLNSAMANGWFTAPNGDVITMGKNFVIVGAANTFGTGPTAEFAGRNKLDAATLDRFAYLPWDTDLAVEKALVLQYLETAEARAWLDAWRTCRKNVEDNGLKVFVTMRGCVNGARLIASGISAADALDMVLLNKLPDEQRRKVAP